MRVTTILSASVLAFACGTQQAPNDDLTDQEVGACVKVDGANIGKRVTVDVPSIDATMQVTITAWVPKPDDPSQFVAFSLDVPATFNVKAGDDMYFGDGATWVNPNGTVGDVRGIEFVELCSARADDNTTPPTEDGSGSDGGGEGSGSDGNCHGHC